MPGPTTGTADGNPSPDALGRAAWSYEQTRGGAFGEVDVWYGQQVSKLIWDPDWYGQGLGVWAGGDDGVPSIEPNRLVHHVQSSVWSFIPRVRWSNPTGQIMSVDISGVLTIRWSGTTDAAIIDNEIIIVRLDATGTPNETLFATTVGKPNVSSLPESLSLTMPMQRTSVAPQESLVVSIRATAESSTTSWMGLTDDLTIEGLVCPN